MEVLRHLHVVVRRRSGKIRGYEELDDREGVTGLFRRDLYVDSRAHDFKCACLGPGFCDCTYSHSFPPGRVIRGLDCRDSGRGAGFFQARWVEAMAMAA